MGPTCCGVVTVTILEQITENDPKVSFWGGVFPAQSAILMGFHNVFGGPGNFPADSADLLRSAGNGVRTPRTDPGFPTPGARMTVV